MNRFEYFKGVLDTIKLVEALFSLLIKDHNKIGDFKHFLIEIERKAKNKIDRINMNTIGSENVVNLINYWEGVRDTTRYIFNKWSVFKDNIGMMNLFLVNLTITLSDNTNFNQEYEELNNIEGIISRNQINNLDSIYYQTAIITLKLIQESIKSYKRHDNNSFLKFIYQMETKANSNININNKQEKNIVELITFEEKPLQYWIAVRDIANLIKKKWNESHNIDSINVFMKKMIVFLIRQERIKSGGIDEAFEYPDTSDEPGSKILDFTLLKEKEDNLLSVNQHDLYPKEKNKGEIKLFEALSLRKKESITNTNGYDKVDSLKTDKATALREALIISGFSDFKEVDRARAIEEALVASGFKEKILNQEETTKDE